MWLLSLIHQAQILIHMQVLNNLYKKGFIDGSKYSLKSRGRLILNFIYPIRKLFFNIPLFSADCYENLIRLMAKGNFAPLEMHLLVKACKLELSGKLPYASKQ